MIDHAEAPPNASSRRNAPLRIAIAAAVTIVVLTALCLLLPQRSKYELCRNTCQLRVVTTKWLWFTDVQLWQAERIVDTAVSRVIEKHRLSTTGTHDWTFCREDGVAAESRACYLIDLPQVALFIDQLARYTDRPTATRWINHILDNGALPLEAEGFPPNGFNSAEQFHTWWSQHQQSLWDACERLTF